jgi:hypothetical protein
MTELSAGALVAFGMLAAAFSTLVACSGSDAKRPGVADAAPDAALGRGGQVNGSGGATAAGAGGMAASSGGAATGGTATGGTATGGTATGGTATGGTATDAGRDASFDASGEASTPACAGAGSGDGGRQWLDVAVGICRGCPASVPTCDDLVRSGASFDRTTHVLVLQLTPELAEIRTAMLSFFYYAQTDAGSDYTEVGPVTGVVDQNKLTFDLGGISPPVNQLTGGGLTLVDACGVTTQTDLDYRALEVDVSTTDAGADIVTLFCYDNV